MRKYDYEKCLQNYCDDFENIENYDKAKADSFKGWLCHHRLETHNSDGERRLVDITHRELKALGMYYHRPANELIFLTDKEHQLLHNKGKHRSEETKKKMAESHKGERHPLYGKHHSEETKKKIAETMKGNKRGPYKRKMKHWKLVDGKRVYY